MKIGALIHFNAPEELENKFASLKEMNFSSCQLCSWHPELFTSENAALISKLGEKYKIEISAFWCGWSGPKVWNFYEGQTTLGLVVPKYREIRIKELCAGADFAKKLGITDVVTHMGFIPENPNDPNFLPFCDAVKKVAEHLTKNDQNLLFEAGQETPVTMLRCFETVGNDNLFVNLDTANLILYGKANPVDALDVFGKYVRGIHAKDGFYPTNGHDLGKEVPIGKGKVDFDAFFRKLYELGYDGYVTIEREIGDENKIEEIKNSAAYLSGIIKRIYGAEID